MVGVTWYKTQRDDYTKSNYLQEGQQSDREQFLNEDTVCANVPGWVKGKNITCTTSSAAPELSAPCSPFSLKFLLALSNDVRIKMMVEKCSNGNFMVLELLSGFFFYYLYYSLITR